MKYKVFSVFKRTLYVNIMVKFLLSSQIFTLCKFLHVQVLFYTNSGLYLCKSSQCI